MLRLSLFTAVVLTAGCATQLTEEGSSVQLITDAAECESLGTVSASNTMAMTPSQDADGAMNRLRNKAAEMGANAVRIIDVSSAPEGTTAIAEALNCNVN
ncbi:MAG: DUF4156 domain-containing protein [Woeseiaceae bacterium]|nr:DUF4156 domain-containing protein [Woeseiaceae bacterium]